MDLFIDESGTFSRGSKTSSVSVVSALITPTAEKSRLFRNYQRVRQRLPKEKGEVKGRLLSEEQVASVLDIVRQANGLLEATVMDAHGHTRDEFERHRARQAHGFVANLTDSHHPTLVAESNSLSDQLLAMSEQQYLQAISTFVLLAQALEVGANYHSLRRPQELASFNWLIDAKERDKETDWERWWRITMMPWLQSYSLRHPSGFIKDGDFSHFERFGMAIPEYLKREIPDRKDGGTNIKLIFGESFRFSSDVEPGLELADIAANAIRRSLVGHLQQPAWTALQSLMVNRKGGCLKYITISGKDGFLKAKPGTAARFFLSGGRNMLTKGFWNTGADSA